MEKTITLGENLKKIRKELKLRQHEITGGQITRNLISLIENNKTPLNKKTARLLCDNINELSKERNMGASLILEDLMVPSRFDAKKKANSYIKKLLNYINNKDFDIDQNYLNEIEEFLQEWAIPEKSVDIYMLIGDLYLLKEDRVAECIYLTKALENYFIKPMKEDIYVLITKLIDNYVSRKKYNEAIRLSKLDLIDYDSMPNYYISRLYYNLAFALQKLEKYDNALESISISKEHLNRNKDSNMLRKVLLLEGDCLNKKGLVDEAIDMYKEIVYTLGNNYSEVCLAYSNIINICMKEEMKNEVCKYLNMVTDILSKVEKNNKNLLDIYTKIAKAYSFLDDYELCENYYIKAYDNSAIRDDNSAKKKVALELFNFYLSTNQQEKIFDKNNIFDEAISVISQNDDLPLLLKYFLINAENNNFDKIQTSIQNLLSKQEKSA